MESLITGDKLFLNKPTECANHQTDDNKRHKDEIESLRAELKYKNEVIKRLNNELKESKQKELHKNININKKGVSGKSKSDLFENNLFGKNPYNNKMRKNEDKVNGKEESNDKRKLDMESKKNKRSITVLGDSIVKDVKPFKMKRMMEKNDRLYVKCFPGANVCDMVDYSKPSLRRNPNVIIFHAGTNSLNTEEEPSKIAGDITKQVIDMKTEHNEVFISSILNRNDKLNEKGKKVNEFLKLNCSVVGLGYIDNSNITNTYLNKSGIHLNTSGTIELAKNFMGAIYT